MRSAAAVIAAMVLLPVPGAVAGAVVPLPQDLGLPPRQVDPPLGVGMVGPALDPGVTLYFYGPPHGVSGSASTPGVPPLEPVAWDSVTFVRGDQNVVIATAPPWFVPEVMKLDYDALLLRAVTLTKEFVEVRVNEIDGRTAWVRRPAVRFTPWPDFLLGAYSVESPDPASNPLRARPLDHGSVIREVAEPMRPIAINGSWIEVTTDGLRDGPPLRGWLRWRDGDRLLIRYSLLS